MLRVIGFLAPRMTEVETRSQTIREICEQTLEELHTAEGTKASPKEDPYNAVFGRDAAEVSIATLELYRKEKKDFYLKLPKDNLEVLFRLQGQRNNPDTNEEVGKIIHEYRRSDYEFLTQPQNGEKPWPEYADKTMRSYDSVDSTPLTLWAAYDYLLISQDPELAQKYLPNIRLGLEWMLYNANLKGDGLLRYRFDPKRKFGGLLNQGWMDSKEAVLDKRGKIPPHPIALVEIQGYAYRNFRLWEPVFRPIDPEFAKNLTKQADLLKDNFNRKFLMADERGLYFAQALDGKDKQVKNVTANPLFCLWASFEDPETGKLESIIEDEYVEDVVKRVFENDMFDPEAGIRTMSTLSPNFIDNETSYHNGSFWPMVNGVAYLGLEKFGFKDEAEKLRIASLKPIMHFNSPVELFIKNNGAYLEYRSPNGRMGSKKQAWTAAFMLHMLQ